MWPLFPQLRKLCGTCIGLWFGFTFQLTTRIFGGVFLLYVSPQAKIMFSYKLNESGSSTSKAQFALIHEAMTVIKGENSKSVFDWEWDLYCTDFSLTVHNTIKNGLNTQCRQHQSTGCVSVRKDLWMLVEIHTSAPFIIYTCCNVAWKF